jgi:hypothetical protein
MINYNEELHLKNSIHHNEQPTSCWTFVLKLSLASGHEFFIGSGKGIIRKGEWQKKKN